MAASKPTDIHTHFRNAVPLVWGSLRLTPISHTSCYYLHMVMMYIVIAKH